MVCGHAGLVTVLQWTADLPSLRSPILVTAFEGLFDVGGAATGAVESLRGTRGIEVGVIDADPSSTSASAGPRSASLTTAVVSSTGPITGSMSWRCPTSPAISCWSKGSNPTCSGGPSATPSPGRDRSRRRDGGHVRRHDRRGAPYPPADHHRFDYRRRPRRRHATRPTELPGPTGVIGVLHERLERAGIPAVSLRASNPSCLRITESKASGALLERFERITGLPTSWADLEDEARAWERRVDEPWPTTTMPRTLRPPAQEHYDRRAESSVPNADDLAAEFERFLRQQDD